MNRTSLFIAGIENLHVSGAPGRGERVGDLFSISSDPAHISRLLMPHVRSVIGDIEASSLTAGRPVALRIVDGEYSESSAHKALTTWLQGLAMFLHTLWYVRDHSADLEMGYLVSGFKTDRAFTTRSFVGDTVTTTAEGETNPITLSRDDFRQARDIFVEFLDQRRALLKQADLNRLQRAFYFIQAARVSHRPALKIASYCTALEAMLSTDTSELSHKLGERVAWLVTTSATDRMKTFQRVKQAYGIRSKVVHGSGGWGDHSMLVETSSFLDTTLRTLFQRIQRSPALFQIFSSTGPKSRERHESLCMSLSLGLPVDDVGTL
jgi:hypothetical protein